MTAPGVYTPAQGSREEELVEMVARAIYESQMSPGLPYRWEIALGGQKYWERQATAAINAIREWEGR